MDFFRKAKNWFQGAFDNNDDEEKKRREAEARARAAQNQPKPKTDTNNVNQFFGQKTQNPVEVINKAQTTQPEKPKPEPVKAPPPLKDKEFVAISEGAERNKKLLGITTPIKTRDVKVDRKLTTNEDKFIAQFDKLPKEYKKIIIDRVKEDAKSPQSSDNQAAFNTLEALRRTNRLDDADGNLLEKAAAIASVPGRSINRVATGVAQTVPGLYDLLTPGEGTNRVSKFFDEVAKNQDKSAKQAGVETAYKVTNIPTEIASYFIPSTLAVKVAGKFPKGAKLTEDIIEKVAKFTDDAGEAGKIRTFLANRMRQNFTLDEALEEAFISARYMGQNTGRGGDTSPASVATDIAAGIGGGLLFPTRSVKKLAQGDNQADEAAGAALTGGAEYVDNAVADNTPAFQRGFGDKTTPPTPQEIYKAEQSAARGEGNPIKDMVDKGLNPTDPNDVPAYIRNNGDEIVADAEKKIADIDSQLAVAPERTLEEYKFTQKQQLAQDIKANPGNKDALIAAYNAKIEAAGNLDNLTAYRSKLLEQKAALEAQVAYTKQLQEQAAKGVAKQADDIAAAQAEQQAVNADVAAESSARTNPAPGDVVETPPASPDPELGANNARQSSEDVLFSNAPKFEERTGLNLFQRLSPDRFIRENITRPIANKIDEGIAGLQRSDNKVGQGIGRFFTGFSREAGISPELQTARMQLRGGVETGKVFRESIADLSKNMPKDSTDRVWASLDPEQAARLGIEPGSLNEAERALQTKLKTLIDNTTAENLRRGLITPEQAAEGSYIKRAYTVFDAPNPEVQQFEQGFRKELLGQYKGRKEVSDEMVEQAITDPTYLVGKKSAESQAVWAMQDYGNYLSSSNIASPVQKVGYTQLPDTAVFGDAAGKWVPVNVAEDFTGFQYSNAVVSAMNDIMTAYDRWGVRQAKKQLLTIFNPAVRLGNQVTNRGIFSQLNGINPVQFNKAYFDAGSEIANNGQLYREAVQQGLTGVDITQAEFFAKRVGNVSDPNLAKKALDWTRTSYSNADDKARVAAYMVHRSRGYSPEEAARQVQRGFQDYKSVGFFYDMAAKTPLIGNAFVRFVADSVRIAKNAGVDHPMRTMGTVALWNTFVNGMSVASGESDLQGDNPATQAFNLVTGKSKSDAQKERESRFGGPKLPFTDVSTAVQTPWGEVNVARFMPWYQLSGINDDGAASVSKFLPISQSPVTFKDGKPQFNGAAFQDPILGQIPQIAADKDFRNKSIRDPGNEDGRFRRDPLSTTDQLKNIGRWFGVNNLPLGKEADQTVSAVMGVPDLYGKERSVPQAIARDLGFKVETYGDEQARRTASMKKYFDEKAQIDAELENMSPDAQEAYKRLTGYDKLRETVTNEFDPSTDRYVKAPVYNFSEDKWKEYAAHPEIYQLMVDKKQRENQPDEDGKKKPIQPEFDQRLSESFRKQLVQNKMVAPGDDAELDQRMYSSPEWDYYQALRKEYKAEADKYFPESSGDNEYVDELVKHQDAEFPEKPDILKQWGAAYGAYEQGKASAKPEFTDEVKAAKEAYNAETFKWTNNERQARGLPPIVWEMWNNPTFGYDETPSGMGFGFGGGGGSTRPYQTNNLGEVTNFTGTVDGYKPINPAEMPNIAQLFRSLQAGRGGSRKKPTLGASSRGQG